MIDLEKLAADVERYVCPEGCVDYYNIEPKDLLKLIAVVRAARDYYFAPYCDDHECGCHEAHHEDLQEALEELK